MRNLITKWNSFFPESRQRLFDDIGLLILRVALGLMMAFSHGWGKFSQLLGEGPIQFVDPIGIGEMPSLVLAAFAEFIASLFVVVGFATRAFTIPLIITMAVAALIVHADDPFMKKEFALLYLTPFVALFLMGPGRFSIDAKLRIK